jgi:hypothetical protein
MFGNYAIGMLSLDVLWSVEEAISGLMIKDRIPGPTLTPLKANIFHNYA